LQVKDEDIITSFQALKDRKVVLWLVSFPFILLISILAYISDVSYLLCWTIGTYKSDKWINLMLWSIIWICDIYYHTRLKSFYIIFVLYCYKLSDAIIIVYIPKTKRWTVIFYCFHWNFEYTLWESWARRWVQHPWCSVGASGGVQNQANNDWLCCDLA
jgi:hypothetical protein